MKAALWLLASLSAAQPASVLATSPGRAEAAEALILAADRIETDYIDPAKARHIAARLRTEARRIGQAPVAGEALARDMTGLLRALSDDPHFGFHFSARPMPADIFTPRSQEAEEAAASRTARVNNFGPIKAERLQGNVGLIDLDAFTAPDRMRKPLAAAMELLRHCDAMIVDLRFNGGGHAEGAALAASYFLPESPTRSLVRFETRDPRETVELRTEAALEAPRFLGKPVYILTGPATFSAAEFFARVLQRAGRATVVGVETRGGGHPSERVRLTPHFGMMLPTTRGVMPGEAGPGEARIRPDLPVPAPEAPMRARKAALESLLAARPDDVLAEIWKKALAEMAEQSNAR